jgi:hypothetical protein
MISTPGVAQTTRIIGLVVREAPNEGTPSFDSNHWSSIRMDEIAGGDLVRIKLL